MISKRRFFKSLILSVAGVTVAPFEQLAFSPRVIELRLTSTPVRAPVRKLKATWTAECDQDLCAMYNIKAERQLMAVLDARMSQVYDGNYQQT